MELLTFTLMLFTFLFANICWLFKKWHDFVKKYEHLPGPKPRWPFLGNLNLLLSKRGSLLKRLNELFEEMYVQHKEDGMFLLLFGPKALLYTHEPEFANELIKDSTMMYKSSEYEFMIPWVGRGLGSANGQEWKAKRKLLNPAFHADVLNNFIPTINDEISKMMQLIHSNIHSEYIDIRELLCNLTTDITLSTVMGLQLNQCDEDNLYAKWKSRAYDHVFRRAYNPLLWSDFIFYKTKIGKEFKEDIENMSNFTMNVIKGRKLRFFNERNKEEKKRRMAFLDLLITYQSRDDSISDRNMMEEVATFILAGNDSMSAALSWAFLLIGHNEEIQNKMLDELRMIFGDQKESEISREDLSKMVYIECVIKETMRIYPPAPFLGRLVPNDLQIKGIAIPKGTNAWFNVLKLHHNEEAFPNPLEFKPERFLVEDTSKIQKCFMPFAAGLRDCIGQRLAMNAMKLVLAHFFRKYTIVSLDREEEIEKVFDFTFHPKGEIRIKLSPHLA